MSKSIQQKTEKNPLSVLRQAIRGVTPDIAVKAKRVGGSTHQVPIEIGSAQGKALAVRWLLGAYFRELLLNQIQIIFKNHSISRFIGKSTLILYQPN